MEDDDQEVRAKLEDAAKQLEQMPREVAHGNLASLVQNFNGNGKEDDDVADDLEDLLSIDSYHQSHHVNMNGKPTWTSARSAKRQHTVHTRDNAGSGFDKKSACNLALSLRRKKGGEAFDEAEEERKASVIQRGGEDGAMADDSPTDRRETGGSSCKAIGGGVDFKAFRKNRVTVMHNKAVNIVTCRRISSSSSRKRQKEKERERAKRGDFITDGAGHACFSHHHHISNMHTPHTLTHSLTHTHTFHFISFCY